MDTMDGIDMVIQESTFINEVQRETMPASFVQETSDMGGGATQEPPPTLPVPKNVERMSLEVNTIPQEPVSTVGQELTQEGASSQSKIFADEGKELKVTDRAGIDQEEDIFHSPFCTTIQRGVRVPRSPQCSEREVVAPPILKLDGLVKCLANVSLLVVDSQQGHSKEQREEEHPTEEWEQ